MVKSVLAASARPGMGASCKRSALIARASCVTLKAAPKTPFAACATFYQIKPINPQSNMRGTDLKDHIPL